MFIKEIIKDLNLIITKHFQRYKKINLLLLLLLLN